MKAWSGRFLGMALVGLLVWLGLNLQTPLHSQTDKLDFDSPNVQVVSTLLTSGTQQIVVVDTDTRTMAVYHVEPAQGKIQLKSVRNLVWDLKMEQFNAQTPLPSELRQVQP